MHPHMPPGSESGGGTRAKRNVARLLTFPPSQHNLSACAQVSWHGGSSRLSLVCKIGEKNQSVSHIIDLNRVVAESSSFIYFLIKPICVQSPFPINFVTQNHQCPKISR